LAAGERPHQRAAPQVVTNFAKPMLPAVAHWGCAHVGSVLVEVLRCQAASAQQLQQHQHQQALQRAAQQRAQGQEPAVRPVGACAPPQAPPVAQLQLRLDLPGRCWRAAGARLERVNKPDDASDAEPISGVASVLLHADGSVSPAISAPLGPGCC
jgi:anti-sigma factor ChrR (cupin superfamily)